MNGKVSCCLEQGKKEDETFVIIEAQTDKDLVTLKIPRGDFSKIMACHRMDVPCNVEVYNRAPMPKKAV